MGIMEFFRSRQVKEKKEEPVEILIEEQKPLFIPDISMLELEQVDWVRFAGVLKHNNLLPNSYFKTPTNMKIGLDKDNRPFVELTFRSATSTSVRKYVLFQQGACEYVNGVLKDRVNPELNAVWADMRTQIRLQTRSNNGVEIAKHKSRGRKMMKEADKLLQFGDFFERELDFLELHKDDTYCAMGIENGLTTVFLKNNENKDSTSSLFTNVKPFSPKTLEFCVSKLDKQAKIEEAEALDYFIQKCNIVRNNSEFETKDWDKVISRVADIIKEFSNENIREM